MFLSRFKIQAMYAQLSDFGIVNREGCKIVWQLAAQAFRYGLQKGGQFQVRCDGVIDFEQNLRAIRRGKGTVCSVTFSGALILVSLGPSKGNTEHSQRPRPFRRDLNLIANEVPNCELEQSKQ